MTTTTTPNLCLPPGYTSRPDPTYFVDDTVVVWQPDVYERVARDERCSAAVLDLGCGNGWKVVQAFGSWAIIAGLDTGPNVALAKRHNVGSWFEFDLEASFPTLNLLEQVFIPTIICADVIEHLRDPSVLLGGLAEAHHHGCPLIAVSSPDRDRLHGPGHLGPPANPCHAREWSAPELVALFASYGMRAEQEWTRSSTGSAAMDTTLLMVGQT